MKQVARLFSYKPSGVSLPPTDQLQRTARASHVFRCRWIIHNSPAHCSLTLVHRLPVLMVRTPGVNTQLGWDDDSFNPTGSLCPPQSQEFRRFLDLSRAAELRSVWRRTSARADYANKRLSSDLGSVRHHAHCAHVGAVGKQRAGGRASAATYSVQCRVYLSEDTRTKSWKPTTTHPYK